MSSRIFVTPVNQAKRDSKRTDDQAPEISLAQALQLSSPREMKAACKGDEVEQDADLAEELQVTNDK